MNKLWGTIGLALALAVTAGAADVDINIVLPVVHFDRDPQLVVIPETYVYFIPDRDDDFFFYQGRWWRPYRDAWFRAAAYNGPWVRVVVADVPPVIVKLPPGWRQLPPGHVRVRWVDVNRYWKQWEREKYWHSKAYWHRAAPPPPPPKAKPPKPPKAKPDK